MTLAEILQNYFGCKVPFRKDGELTTTGAVAFQRLESLLDNLKTLGVIEASSRCTDEIYAILNENY